MEKYEFTVRIDGQECEYEVLANGEEDARRRLLGYLRTLDLGEGGGRWVWLIVAGIAVLVYLFARKRRALNPSADGIVNRTPPRPMSDDNLADGPAKLEPWPWRTVDLSGVEARGAGPLEYVDKSFKVILYTDSTDLDFIKAFIRPYVPETDDHDETAGLIVLVVPTSKYPVEIEDSSMVDAVLASDVTPFADVAVRASTADALAAGLREHLRATLNIKGNDA